MPGRRSALTNRNVTPSVPCIPTTTCVAVSWSTASDMVDGKMGFLFFLAVVALGAIAWLLFRIDTKLQAIGNMIHNANSPEEPWRLTD